MVMKSRDSIRAIGPILHRPLLLMRHRLEALPAIRLILEFMLGVFALGLIAATVIPLVHTNQWWVRLFDFPRLQLAVLMISTLIGYGGLRYWFRLRRWEVAIPTCLGLALLWQFYQIIPYTLLVPYQMAEHRDNSSGSQLSLLISNVRYDNREVSALLEVIREADPDVVLLVEPTLWWAERLEVLEENYPHVISRPQENHYGMLLYSRLELVDPKVRFLVEPTIPSIRTGVRLASGEVTTLYGLHTRPPGIKKSDEPEREDSDLRDAALLQVAREVAPLERQPVIVAGDFNDVAWSHTTELFQEISGLLDPRVGRGLYNTFNAESRFLRYPLDHVFASDHFRLVELRRLPKVGSDHFPILAVLDYDPSAAAKQDEPTPDSGDMQEAEEMIEEERE